jgi:hypothetical protein
LSKKCNHQHIPEGLAAELAKLAADITAREDAKEEQHQK